MKNSNYQAFAMRLYEILHRLNNGETLYVRDLAEELGVSVRTIQRDLNDYLAFLPWLPRNKEDKGYKSDKTHLGHLTAEDIGHFARFCSIQDLLPSIDKQFYQKTLLQSVRVKGFQYENIKRQRTRIRPCSGSL